MRILFLSTQLPFPPKSGGVIKSWNLVHHWSQKYDLRLIHPLKNNEADHLPEFKEKIDLEDHFHVPVHVDRTGLNLIRSYLGHASLNVFRNYDKRIAQKVEEWAQDSDIIFVDHYEMGQYIPAGHKGKVVLHEHNAEFIMWKRLAEIEKNPFKKLILEIESKRILKAEKKYADRADLILAAPNDIEELSAQGIDSSKMEKTYHLGEDFLLEKPDMEFGETSKALLYVGTLSWEANIDGLIWFIDKCWESLEAKNEGLQLTIVGKNPDKRILKAANGKSGISFSGFVEDLEECYPLHRVFIVPLRFGSGIKVKILNALYRGIPTVTTAIGTEGLDIVDGQHIYECNGVQEFVSRTHELLNEETSWSRLSRESRILSRDYTWDKLLQSHDEQLEGLL